MGAYDIVIYHGKKLDRFSMQRLQAAERRLGYELTIIQGSYNSGVSASAGTHDGGGAVDLSAWDWENKCRILRQEGWAAWLRPAIPGLWNAHIHAIQYDNKRLSSGAQSQVRQYYNHTNGLASYGWDSQWRPAKIPHFKYHRKPRGPRINIGHLQAAWAREKGRVYNSWGKKTNRTYHKVLKDHHVSGPKWNWSRAWFDHHLRASTVHANRKYDITKYTGKHDTRPTWALLKKLGARPYRVKVEKRPRKQKIRPFRKSTSKTVK